MKKIKIGKKIISEKGKTFFVADIASNHDGSLKKAKKLIRLAAKSGADAAKFQNFYAKTLVSDYGFKNLPKNTSHQNKWKKSVYETYKENEVSIKWTSELQKECKKNKIEYFTAPYDVNVINYLNKFVKVWKVGSGDITYLDNILKMAKTQKPILIATGASNQKEIDIIINKVKRINNNIVIMQCNTNYTAEKENFNYINLNVLKTFKKKYPFAILGLSDHTLGHETVLGAVALGARVIEKHFTDSNKKIGPDHKFSMNPKTWRSMVNAVRNLEKALGNESKFVEKNEKTTIQLQRRSIRLKKNIQIGYKIKKNDLEFLRPCPSDAIQCYDVNKILNKRIKFNLKKGDYFKLKHLKLLK